MEKETKIYGLRAIIEAIEAEVGKIAEANDKLETVQKHFKNT